MIIFEISVKIFKVYYILQEVDLRKEGGEEVMG